MVVQKNTTEIGRRKIVHGGCGRGNLEEERRLGGSGC
jgi:hypothetical protein